MSDGVRIAASPGGRSAVIHDGALFTEDELEAVKDLTKSPTVKNQAISLIDRSADRGRTPGDRGRPGVSPAHRQQPVA